MDRRDLLKGLGLVSAGSLLPLSKTLAAADGGLDRVSQRAARDLAAKRLAACWLTPQKTEGPFYFNPNLVRQDVTEGRTGAPLHLVITVMNASCIVLPNILVDIWHCDKDGLYSGYNQPGGNTVGQTFMRGTQATDASGIARFDTVYPGWYQGRATHIHFKARLTASTYVTSQFAFPEDFNSAVYATPLYVGRGANPISNAADMVFQATHPTYLEVALGVTGSGYIGMFTIGINADLPVEATRWGTMKSVYR